MNLELDRRGLFGLAAATAGALLVPNSVSAALSDGNEILEQISLAQFRPEDALNTDSRLIFYILPSYTKMDFPGQLSFSINSMVVGPDHKSPTVREILSSIPYDTEGGPITKFFEKTNIGILKGDLHIVRLSNKIARQSRRGRGNIVIHNFDGIDQVHNPTGVQWYFEENRSSGDISRYTFIKWEGLPKGDVIAMYKGPSVYDGPIIRTSGNRVALHPEYKKYFVRSKVIS